MGSLLDPIKDWFSSLVENVLYRIFYFLETLILRFVALVEDTMMIFTGEKTITYESKDTTLIDVFFNHNSIKGIYTGIAAIGIMFAFAFTIIAVIKKAADLRDKQQGVGLGVIIGNLFKSIILIVGMNFLMIVAISTTTVLTSSISDAVQYGSLLTEGPSYHNFTDEEYAAMGRIINTIGNYSLNPSYRSRYNLNACYNDIRRDLEYLGQRGIFNFHYVTYDEKQQEEVTWQKIMEELGTAYDYTQEAPIDSYDSGLTSALLNSMELLRRNNKIRVLESFEREKVQMEIKKVPMDRILFLVGTMGTIGDNAAARNNAYNKNPDFSDPVRRPFYVGETSIYSWDKVRKAFDPSPVKMNYLLVYAIAVAILMEMLVIIVTCAVRIFNLLTLYLASPLVIAAKPLDDGGKLKQWTTAFIVQLLSVVGLVLAMRLMLMFLPIIWSPSLKVSNNAILGCIIKAVITYGAVTAVNRVNGILTGILADSAGYQAITAGDMRGAVKQSAIGQKLSSVSGSALAGKAAGAATSAVGGAAKAVGGAGAGGAANMASKWGGKLAEKTGLASVGRALRSAAEAVGVVKEHDKSQDPKTVQQARTRSHQRQEKKLGADIDYAKQHGTHRDGRVLKQGELAKMESTLKHMQGGNSLSDAKKLAAVDMAEDKKDQKMEEKEHMKEVKAGQNRPLPRRQNPLAGAGNADDDDEEDLR